MRPRPDRVRVGAGPDHRRRDGGRGAGDGAALHLAGPHRPHRHAADAHDRDVPLAASIWRERATTLRRNILPFLAYLASPPASCSKGRSAPCLPAAVVGCASPCRRSSCRRRGASGEWLRLIHELGLWWGVPLVLAVDAAVVRLGRRRHARRVIPRLHYSAITSSAASAGRRCARRRGGSTGRSSPSISCRGACCCPSRPCLLAPRLLAHRPRSRASARPGSWP